MGDRLWRQDRDNARGRPFLKALADFRSVKAAGDPTSAKECHEKCRLRVALAISIREYFFCGKRVGAVISKKDLISDIVIDRANSVECVELFPATRLDQISDRCGIIVYHRGLLKIFIFHTVPLFFCFSGISIENRGLINFQKFAIFYGASRRKSHESFYRGGKMRRRVKARIHRGIGDLPAA